jgi:hypothetical protein
MRLSLSLCPVTLSGTAPAPRVRLEALCSKFKPLSQAICFGQYMGITPDFLWDRKPLECFHRATTPSRSWSCRGKILLSTWETLLTYLISVSLKRTFIRPHSLTNSFLKKVIDYCIGNTPLSWFIRSELPFDHDYHILAADIFSLRSATVIFFFGRACDLCRRLNCY